MKTILWPFTVAAAAWPCLVSMAACNAVTGVEDIRLQRPSDNDDTGSGGSGAGGGASSGGTSSNPPPMDDLYATPGVSIKEIAIYQGIKRPLMQGGGPASSTIPVVAGRDALLRVFVSTDTSYKGQKVTAKLTIPGTAAPLTALAQSLPSASTDDALSSTLNFDIPGASISTDFQYSVTIGQTDDSGSPALSYPASGAESVGAKPSGATLKVQLVPVAYGADGSNRVPDTSQAIQDKYRDGYFAAYPIPGVEISLHKTMQWNQQISAFGNGWSQLLDAVASLRQSEGAPADLYYFAIFAPAATFGQYCSQGCVLGLAPLSTGPSDNYSRAAIGVSYGDDESIITAIHETGHNHGRQHAPCQVQDPDPQYPHPNGQIGVWGYDLINKQLFPPTTADFMSYCEPNWVSDYTFLALFNRLKAVNNAVISFPPELLDKTYDRALIDESGNARWIEPLKMHTPPVAEPASVVLETDAGDKTVSAQLYRFDHLPGGVLFWPQSRQSYKAARFQIGAGEQRLQR